MRAVLLFVFICVASADWIAISDYSVTTWDPSNANRSETLTTFKTTNYSSKYIKQLTNRINTYTYDQRTKTIYFVMQQPQYGISKFFSYNMKTNVVSQTSEVLSFMIDHIQFNTANKQLYAIVHGGAQRQYWLVQVDPATLQVAKEIVDLTEYGSPMSGSYFNSTTQLFTYHAYNSRQSSTVLVSLNLSTNAPERFVSSKPFDFNVYGFGYIPNGDKLVALWQYSIITPMVAIKIDEQTGEQIQNVTITPDGVRIAQGYKPFSVDNQKGLFYVLSWVEDFSTTYISKINMDTMKVQRIDIEGKVLKDYIFFKKY